MSKVYSYLGHKYSFFTKQNILNSSSKHGLQCLSALETHLWVYELCYQIQVRTADSCILKGGACAQLYLPLNQQRCTLDLDMSTTLSEKELWILLKSIVDDFNKHNFISNFREYVPRFTAATPMLPMKTFLFTLPFIFKKGRSSDYADIKIDFLFSDTNKLTYHNLSNRSTIGLNLNYSPLCLTQYSIISSKLIAFASSSIGLHSSKIESFYKNVYDCFYLIKSYSDTDILNFTSNALQQNINTELKVRTLSVVNIEAIIEDILATLYRLFTWDLLTTVPKIPYKLSAFEEKYIQNEIRNVLNLDSWALMAMYIFIWTSALKETINGSPPTNVIKLVLK